MRYTWRIPWNALTTFVWMSTLKWSTVSTLRWYLTKEYFRGNIQLNRFEFMNPSWRKTVSIHSMARRFRRNYTVLWHSFCLTRELMRIVCNGINLMNSAAYAFFDRGAEISGKWHRTCSFHILTPFYYEKQYIAISFMNSQQERSPYSVHSKRIEISYTKSMYFSLRIREHFVSFWV